MNPAEADIGQDLVPGSPAPETDQTRQNQALVQEWQKRIMRAKKKWEPDFERMRKNMEFAAGIQWPGQETIDTDKYVVHLTMRLINQKIATLYAKDPKVIYERVARRDFAIWDEEPQTIVEAGMQASAMLEAGMELPPELSALFEDIHEGMLWRKHIEAIGDTLEKLWDITIRSQKPEFKEQLKQALGRACICGVAYGRPVLCRAGEYYKKASTTLTDGDLQARAQVMLNRLDDAPDEQSADHATLRSFSLALGASPEIYQEGERLEFDFAPATSVIVDERCRSLTGFVAARWIAQEYILPVDEVNSIFLTDVKIGGKEAATDTNEREATVPDLDYGAIESDASGLMEKKLVRVWEVFDSTTRTKFFIAQGHKDFLCEPEPPEHHVSGFYPIFALTLNRIEVEPGCKVSIFPPSDVQTIKSAQLEYNRSREDLRDQRRANAPAWLYREGVITEEDKAKITAMAPNTGYGVKGVPPDMPLEKVFVARPTMPIDPKMYDTVPLEQDIYMSGGMQQADLGPAQPNTTATGNAIAEQARNQAAQSNVDDLDGFLGGIVQCGGELMLQGFSPETVTRAVGRGAVWPQEPEIRRGIMGEVLLKVEAASSGRPNKAMDVANWRDLAPILMQTGANPIGMVHETVRRLDDSLDVSKFYPLLPMGGGPAPGGEAKNSNEQSNSTASPQGEAKPPGPPGANAGPGAPNANQPAMGEGGY